MWDPTPWVVTDADISPEMARLVAYATSGGAEGIIEPPDLRVRALATPGNRVRIAPGGALVKNRYAGGGQQTYALRNSAQHNSPVITATGSSGARSDLVVARVLDPNYEGDAPSDPNDFQYARTEVIEGVPSNTRSARDLNLNYPAIALARIDIPTSTATITNAMITDLRFVATPRIERRLFAYNLTQADGAHSLTATGTGGQWWPDLSVHHWTVDVPEWATHANVVATWGGVQVVSNDAQGWIWARLGWAPGTQQGPVDTQHQRWDLTSAGGQTRESWQTADDITIPVAFRGLLDVPIRLLGRRTHGTGSHPRVDSGASISVDIQFTEGPA